MEHLLMLILRSNLGASSARAGTLTPHVACLREMSRHVTSETVNRVGSGYVFFTGANYGPPWPDDDGLLVLTAQALHGYTDPDLKRRHCGGASRIDRFGTNEADDYDFYGRFKSRYRLLALHFDQSDLRGVNVQIAVERENGRYARLLGWAQSAGPRPGYCRLTGHQIMDAAGKWRGLVDQMLISALDNFYRRGSAVAKLTEDPAMMLGPLAVCGRVPSAAVREIVARLRQQFTEPSPAAASPEATPSSSAR